MLAKGVVVTSLAVLVLTPLHLGAETVTHAGVGAIAPPNTGAQRTGKERLGEKWKDEQRIGNCKVPPDKHGPKPRPNSCWPSRLMTTIVPCIRARRRLAAT